MKYDLTVEIKPLIDHINSQNGQILAVSPAKHLSPGDKDGYLVVWEPKKDLQLQFMNDFRDILVKIHSKLEEIREKQR